MGKQDNKNKLIKVKKDIAKKSVKAKKNVDEKKIRKRKRRGKILNAILILIMLGGILVMGAVLAFCAFIVISAPPFETDKLYSKEATILYDKNGNEIDRIGKEQRELKTYDDLPQVLVDAIVATEDSRFFQHNGFDIVRFTKAGFGQIAGQSGAGGASTLTMQIVKNNFTSKEASGIKGIIRKFTDIYMAVFKIEKNYTKEEIMEFYVNDPFLGSNTYGVEQACQVYFGKSVNDITLPEAALIAGIFNAPTSYNPYGNIDLATKRRSTVLNLMVRHGYITKEQADDAKAITVESLLNNNPIETGLNEYQSFIDVVVNDVLTETGHNPYDVPMLIYTTLDPEKQKTLNKLNAGELGYKWKDDNIQIGLAVIDVKDGSIAAVDGGRNQTTQRALNRATVKSYQPGSTIKPIMDYGPYIEYNNGSPGTIFYDIPYTFSNGTKITNSDNGYKGAMTMRQALVQSRNIPALQAFQAVDKDRVSEFAKNCGIDYYQYNYDGTIRDKNLYESYAIGGGMEVSVMDMAGAYATFARGGTYIKPYSYTKIIYEESDEVEEYKIKKKEKIMSPETAYLINDMLVSATHDGVGGNINVKGTDVASKTGTSTIDSALLKREKIPDSASMDNWVITYSPDYVISFNYRYDVITHNTWTNAIPAAIQRKLISAVVANNIYKKGSKFTKPSGVISSKYEKETTPPELPSQFTPGNLIGSELFKKGSEPSVISNRFEQLSNPDSVRGSESGGSVTLSWSAAPQPQAADEKYLKDYFINAYGKDHYKRFYDRRLSYNSTSVGNVGYQVYMTDAEGEHDLGYTDGTVFTYTPTYNGNYLFTVRTAYSIYKANQSSGVSVNVNVSGGNDQSASTDTDNGGSEEESNVNVDPPTLSFNNAKFVNGEYNVCRPNVGPQGTQDKMSNYLGTSSNVTPTYTWGGETLSGQVTLPPDKNPYTISVKAENSAGEVITKSVNLYICSTSCTSDNTCQ